MERYLPFIIFFIIIILFVSTVNAASNSCGDGYCDLSIGESHDNCPSDCIGNNINSVPDDEKCFVGDEEVQCPQSNNAVVSEKVGRILPEYMQNDYNYLFFIVPFLTMTAVFLFLLISKVKIAGKTAREYLFPIKYYVIISILTVFSQYLIGIPIQETFPLFINFTQALWALMVVISVITLINKFKDFDMKNVVVLGLFYSFIIHGLKVYIRYQFYNMPVWYLYDRLLYGSFLVMVVVLIVGPVFIQMRKRGIKVFRQQST